MFVILLHVLLTQLFAIRPLEFLFKKAKSTHVNGDMSVRIFTLIDHRTLHLLNDLEKYNVYEYVHEKWTSSD